MVAMFGLTSTVVTPSSLKRLDRLAAGVVELAGLADLERAAAEDQDFHCGSRGCAHNWRAMSSAPSACPAWFQWPKPSRALAKPCR